MYTFSSDLSKLEYDEFAQKHKNTTFFQSSQWALVKNNWTPIYTGVYKDNKLVAASLILKRKLLFKYSFLYSPRGPLLDFENKELLSFFLENLKGVAKAHSALSLTLDPYIIRAKYSMSQAIKDQAKITYDDSIVEYFEKADFNHKSLGLELHDTIQPRFQPTIYFDEAADFKNSRGYKNGIKARNSSVKIKRINLEDIDEFLAVIEKTEEHQNINLRGRTYFENLLTSFKDKSLISIAYLDLKAELESLVLRKSDMEKRLENPNMREGRRREYESQLEKLKKDLVYINEQQKIHGDQVNVAGVLALRSDSRSELLYAGMDRDFQNYLGSNLNYVDAMDWSIEADCTALCLGGSSGHFNDGISRFKSSFDPILEEYIGEFIFVNKKILNSIFNMMLKLREKITYKPNN